ncbi:MAG: sulfotransferase domain-containing protein [Candidatus Thermoplasmatota archaeon]
MVNKRNTDIDDVLKNWIKEKIDEIWYLGSIANNPQNVVLTGSPRSGTTWFLETLESSLDSRRMWEPFRENTKNGMGRRPYLKVDESNQTIELFLEKIFEGEEVKYIGRNNFPFSKLEWLKSVFFADYTIFKFCRAQRLLPWLNQNFNVKSILIMRHPLAVVASQIFHQAFTEENTDHPMVSKKILNDFPRLGKFALNLDRFEEKLAASWCFDYLIPLENWNLCNNTMLVTYEQMITNPAEELNRIGDFLGVEVPDDVYLNLSRPSQTTVDDSNVKNKNKSPLTTWKERLSQEEINNILAVLEKFEIDFYSKNLLPDYKKIREKYNINL